MDENDKKTYGNITIKVKKKKETFPKLKIEDLHERAEGTFTFEARINKILQTRGPTIFKIKDDTGDIDIQKYEGAGVRAYPELNEGECAEFTAKVDIINSVKRINIISYEKIECPKELVEEIVKTPVVEEPTEVVFTIDCPAYDALKDRFHKAATLIKRSVAEGRPILIRHHADTDGYAGAIALERAILPIIESMHGEKERWYSFDRTPSSTPFYEYKDVLRDLTFAKRSEERFKKLTPLVILVDNGSTEEDLMSLKKAKIYDIPMIVIDHHYTPVTDGVSIVDDYINVHINPYLVGSDKNITAGMLAYELSRIINPSAEDLKIVPALSAVGDRSECPEREKYLKLSGANMDDLKKIVLCLDYEAFYLRFMQDAGLIFDLISDDGDRIVSLLYPEIEKKMQSQKVSLEKYAKKEDLKNGILYALVGISQTTIRSEFPGPGKAIGLLNDSLNETHKGKPIVTIGWGEDYITLRSNEECEKKGFNLNLLVTRLKKELPHAMVEGGGHEVAGSISFLESAKDEVLSKLKSYISEL